MPDKRRGYDAFMPNFRTTRWSLIAAANNTAEPKARQALAELCELYWYPIYAYIRRTGHNADRAQDLTQEFFARLLEKRGIAGADQSRGRFRNYLLGAVRHFLANELTLARDSRDHVAVAPRATFAWAVRAEEMESFVTVKSVMSFPCRLRSSVSERRTPSSPPDC